MKPLDSDKKVSKEVSAPAEATQTAPVAVSYTHLQQNEQFGRKAEPLIFPVCTDTGCACYSLKSHIRRYNALPLSQKQGRLFFENFSF